MPERCETCKWFKGDPHKVFGDVVRDGICWRFPHHASVDCHHKCGEWTEDVKTHDQA